MILSVDYEFEPEGSILIYSGGAKQDDGGSWVPQVFQVGPQRYQCGAAPQNECGRVVVHRTQLSDLSEAKIIANDIARLAAT